MPRTFPFFLVVALVATASMTWAGGSVPRGLTLTYQCRSNPEVTAQLVYDAIDGDYDVGIADADTVHTLRGVVRAVWDDGLSWYFTDDSMDGSGQIFFHGFRRPGSSGVFFPEQVWVPALPERSQVGYSWTWTGRGPPDYVEKSIDYNIADAKVINVPYGSFDAFKITRGSGPAKGAHAGGCFDEQGSGDPRWYTTLNSYQNAYCILIRDALWELVSVEDDMGPIVPTATRSFGSIKARFE